jgi:prephenate dehydrogenase
MRLSLLGVGLIGGSIARSVRASAAADAASVEIVGWTPRGVGARAAKAAGVVDEVARDLRRAVGGADLIVLAAPPLACLELLDAIGETSALAGTGLVTDVASTKLTIVERALAAGIPFVGGHPMAGREISGFATSSEDLFEGRPWVLVEGPTSPPGGVERVERLVRWCRATPIAMTAEEHDDAVAAISHVPLVLSAALAEAVAGDAVWRSAGQLAASGWTSMTRLARGDPEMGAGILATNRQAVAEKLGRLRVIIEAWERDIDRADPVQLEERLDSVRHLLQELESP